MDQTITILEGVAVFQKHEGPIFQSYTEGAIDAFVASTVMRSTDGEKIMEKCRTAWEAKSVAFLNYKDFVGLERTAPVLAAKKHDGKTEEGLDVVTLFVRFERADFGKKWIPPEAA